MTNRPPPPGRPPQRPANEGAPGDRGAGPASGQGPGQPPQRPQGYGPPPGYLGPGQSVPSPYPTHQQHPQHRAEPPYGHAQHGPQHYGQTPPYQQAPYQQPRAPMPAPPRDRMPPPRQAQPQRRAGMGSFFVYGLLGLAALVIGAGFFAVLALPAGFVRDRAVAAVKERTGRDLVIAGPASMTVFPAFGISLGDVSLSGAPGSGKSLVSMKALDVSVELWPLLRQEVRVKAVTLRDPVLNLDVDANGRRSWEFSSDDRAAWTRVAQFGAAGDAATDAQAPVSRSLIRLSDLSIDDVRIENGAILYTDAGEGRVSEVSAINARLSVAGLTNPLNAEGSLALRGRTLTFKGNLTSLAEVLGERPAKLKLALGGDVLDATYEGALHTKQGISTEGILSAKSASARDLFAWFGSDLPPSKGFGPLAAKGLMRGSPDKLLLTTAEIVLDDTTARGEIELDTRGPRPGVTATLMLDALDLNTYKSIGEARAKADAQPRDKSRGATSIDDLLDSEQPAGPRVKGYTRRDGWSEETLDLDALGALDAKAKLTIGKLTIRDLHLGQTDLVVALKNRLMIATFEKVELYEGTGAGTVTLDGTAGSAAGLDLDLNFNGVAVEPLLADAAGIDRVSGAGRLALTLTGRGATEREIVETLNGRIDAAFSDGAIKGANVTEMVNNLARGNLGGLKASPDDKTQFSELTASWTVKNGIAESQDLKIVSPAVRLSGAGQVSLPARTVDYMLRPKLVANLEGQGGAQTLGIEVPVRMHGPWNDPEFTPDVAGALNDPKTAEAIKAIGEGLKSRNAGDLVNELMSDDKETRKKAKEKGKKLLEQFLGPQ